MPGTWATRRSFFPRPPGFRGFSSAGRRLTQLLTVRPEHETHRRPVEPIGLAELVDQKAAVRIGDFGRVVGADEEGGGTDARLGRLVEADVAAGAPGGWRLVRHDLLDELVQLAGGDPARGLIEDPGSIGQDGGDRKSTRLNSSHLVI